MKTDIERRSFSSLRLLGGCLCLDFVNTMNWRYPKSEGEYLYGYSDLLNWSQHVRIATLNEVATLSREFAKHPASAEMIFHEAIQLRETLYRVFVGVIHKQAPTENDLALINTVLSEALSNLMIQPINTEFQWQWGEL